MSSQSILILQNFITKATDGSFSFSVLIIEMSLKIFPIPNDIGTQIASINVVLSKGEIGVYFICKNVEIKLLESYLCVLHKWAFKVFLFFSCLSPRLHTSGSVLVCW